MANHGPSFGLSRELERKNQARFSIEEALEVLLWMEEVNDMQFKPPLSGVTTAEQVSELLKDGVQLCMLMNRLNSTNSSVISFNRDARKPFPMMENISKFLDACKAYGVSEISCFQTVDLYENKHPYKVIECLRSLAAVAQSKQILIGGCPKSINFPPWVVKMAHNRPRKEFTKKILSEAVIPLQYGTNKCASQKGMTPYGLARQIKQSTNEKVPVENGSGGTKGMNKNIFER